MRSRHVPSTAARLAVPVSVTARSVIFVGIGDVGGSVVGVIDLLGVLLGSLGVIVLDPVPVALPSSG